MVECPNCNFQNVPGLRACARCQSLLELSCVSIDPPRAADVILPLSVRHAATRASISLRDACFVVTRKTGTIFHPDVDMAALTRSIIPGWGHYHLGHKWFGWLIACIWLGLAVLTLLLMGGPSGRVMYFLLVGWHGLAISLILAKPLNGQTLPRRAVTGLLMYALLNLAIYLPARWLIQGVASPFSATGIADGGLLRDGDTVVQTGRWNRPRTFHPGDVVIYEIKPIAEYGAYIRGGTGIDRIVAGPGDLVTSNGTSLFVNRLRIDADHAPLRRPPTLQPFQVTLGHDQYFIVPSLFDIQGQQTARFQDLLVRASVVSQEQISGKVLFRSRPWSRFGPIGRLAEIPHAGENKP